MAWSCFAHTSTTTLPAISRHLPGLECAHFMRGSNSSLQPERQVSRQISRNEPDTLLECRQCHRESLLTDDVTYVYLRANIHVSTYVTELSMRVLVLNSLSSGIKTTVHHAKPTVGKAVLVPTAISRTQAIQTGKLRRRHLLLRVSGILITSVQKGK